jgi:hypothetical protein
MEPLKPLNLKQPLIIGVLTVLAIIYLISWLNTGNPLWFLRNVQPAHRPNQIILRHYGQTIVLRPGDPHFEEITTALNDSLTSFRTADLVRIGLGDATLRRYHEQEFVLETHYAEAITFNTPVRMRNINQLLIPIDAAHAGMGYLFLGTDGRWLAGAMQMNDPEPLLQTLRDLGYTREAGR